MAKIWRNRIIAGDQLYSDCPAVWKTGVLKLLKADVANGTITAEEFKEFTGMDYVA